MMNVTMEEAVEGHPTESSSMTLEETRFSEIIGDLVEQWGFKRHLGRIWSLLYLRQEALTPKQIQAELSLSAGNVNALLSELQTWGVIKRMRVPADRNSYFEVQPSIWKSISNVLHTRELRILEEAIGGLHDLRGSLEKSPNRERVDFQIARIENVKEVIGTAFTVATTLVNSPPERLARVGKLISRLRKM